MTKKKQEKPPQRNGATRICDERVRQVLEEDHSLQHDVDEHDSGELVQAAFAYAACAIGEKAYLQGTPFNAAEGISFYDPWPWDEASDKRPPKKPTQTQRIRMLEKAGALIAAEIDRLLNTPKKVPFKVKRET